MLKSRLFKEEVEKPLFELEFQVRELKKDPNNINLLNKIKSKINELNADEISKLEDPNDNYFSSDLALEDRLGFVQDFATMRIQEIKQPKLFRIKHKIGDLVNWLAQKIGFLATFLSTNIPAFFKTSSDYVTCPGRHNEAPSIELPKSRSFTPLKIARTQLQVESLPPMARRQSPIDGQKNKLM